MSKAIRWQLHFHEAKPDSQNPKHYRVDIYDEQDGTWSGITQLTAGDQPFVTDEDASDDFFCPVRTQTGTLQICTLKPDGQYITLDELLPANNIARPVKVWQLLGGGAAGILEWQGFMSCEAYSQDYVGIPQTLSFPVNGILEAMASVQLNQTRSSGLQPVYVCLPAILKEIDIQSGVTCFTHLNYSRTDYRIISKYIDMTVMFEQKEYNNENGTTYIVSGLSAKDALTRICTYMGWIAREKGSEIYLQRIGEEIGMYREEIDEFPGVAQEISIIEAGIAATFADKWRGTDHQRTVSQGAKYVEVVAKLEKYDMQLSLPEFPYVDMETYSKTMDGMTSPYGSLIYNGVTIQSIISKNTTFYNNCTIRLKELNPSTGAFMADATIAQVLSWALVNPNRVSVMDAYETAKYVGAFFARIKKNEDDYLDGLYIVGNHYWQSTYTSEDDTSHIFRIQRLQRFVCQNGKLVLKIKVSHLTIGDAFAYYDGDECSIHVCVKFGDKYWDGSQWSTSFARFTISNTQGKDGYEIPCESLMQGNIEIRFYKDNDFSGILNPDIQYKGKDKFVSELSISYERDNTDLLTDRSENHYFRLLGTNFRDEISVGTDLASTLNNEPSPSLIMNSETEAMTELNYGTDQVPDMRRPEVDLLNRLAAYYSAARQRLELEVAHPTDAPLPLLKLNGINDGKVYLPMSESRDWQTDVCKLTCFELPE